MSANAARFQLMFLGNRSTPDSVKVGKDVLKPTDCVNYIQCVCKKSTPSAWINARCKSKPL